jgi:hypothetical protein
MSPEATVEAKETNPPTETSTSHDDAADGLRPQIERTRIAL